MPRPRADRNAHRRAVAHPDVVHALSCLACAACRRAIISGRVVRRDRLLDLRGLAGVPPVGRLGEDRGRPRGHHDDPVSGQRGEVGDGQDRRWRELPAGARAGAARRTLRAGACDEAVVLADQLLQIGEELLLGHAAAVDAHVRRAPELAHPCLAPHLCALRPGLKQGQQRDASRSVVRIQIGQLPPAADVRGLIQDAHEGNREAPSGGALGELLGRVA